MWDGPQGGEGRWSDVLPLESFGVQLNLATDRLFFGAARIMRPPKSVKKSREVRDEQKHQK